MSDFFSRLAGRLEGTLPVLRPRLPSLFENAHGMPWLGDEVAPSQAIKDTEREPEPSPPLSHEMERAPYRSVPPAAEEGANETRHRVRTRHSTDIREERGESEEPSNQPVSARRQPRKTIRPEAPHAPVAEPPRDTTRPLPLAVQAALLPVKRAQPALVRGRTRAIDRAEKREQEASVTHDTPSPLRAPAAQPEAPVPLRHVRPSPPPFAPLPPMPPSSVRERPALSREAAEPTIQVSIGRIDIRAEREAAPRRKSAETSPVMSLDEYLRSRAK
jgi:hypothetical protein